MVIEVCPRHEGKIFLLDDAVKSFFAQQTATNVDNLNLERDYCLDQLKLFFLHLRSQDHNYVQGLILHLGPNPDGYFDPRVDNTNYLLIHNNGDSGSSHKSLQFFRADEKDYSLNLITEINWPKNIDELRRGSAFYEILPCGRFHPEIESPKLKKEMVLYEFGNDWSQLICDFKSSYRKIPIDEQKPFDRYKKTLRLIFPEFSLSKYISLKN